MNIYKDLSEIEEARDRIRASQDSILDIYDSKNPAHIRILKEISKLLNEYDRLEKKYLALVNK
jgi:hypothetical protein